jgi:hypothetical protein
MRFAACQAGVVRPVADDPIQSPGRTAGTAEEKLATCARAPARGVARTNHTFSLLPLWSFAGSALKLSQYAAPVPADNASLLA